MATERCDDIVEVTPSAWKSFRSTPTPLDKNALLHFAFIIKDPVAEIYHRFHANSLLVDADSDTAVLGLFTEYRAG